MPTCAAATAGCLVTSRTCKQKPHRFSGEARRACGACEHRGNAGNGPRLSFDGL